MDAERGRRVHEALLARGATVACAESLTGGALAELFTATPGASATFRGGVVSYATEVKVDVLGVSAATVAAYGVVSEECAQEMAVGVRVLMGSTYAVSTTGVAGPDTQEGRPVGFVCIGLAGPDGARSSRHRFPGGRAEIREAAVHRAADLLRGFVEATG
ncbi:MAG: CinA family protein [Nocardioidaceae bacterium]